MNDTTQTSRKEEFELLKKELWGNSKDDVFKKMEIYDDAYVSEFLGYLSHGDNDENSDALMSTDWDTDKFWEEDNYSENGWRAYFSQQGANLYQFIKELSNNRTKDATKLAEEQQVEHEQDLNMESNMGLVGDTKGAEGGYLGR